MKDSGIPWIGSIPDSWVVLPIKRIKDSSHPYPIGDGDHGTIKPENYIDDGIPYIRVQNLSWGGEIDTKGIMYISEEVHERNLKSELHPKDILIAKTGATIGKTGIIPTSMQRANTTSSVAKITVSKDYYYKFIFYALGSDMCLSQMWIKASQKSAQPGFNVEDLVDFKICLPSYIKQKIVADFLDRKCSLIDDLISLQEKMIEELKAYKQSVITEAVTKGLNPDVQLKYVNIFWIDKIPANWNVKRGKNVLLLCKRLVRDDDDVVTCFRDGEVILRRERREEGFTMSDKEIGYQGIDKGDIVIHGMDGFAGAIGISKSKGKGSPVLIVCNPKYDAFPQYLVYYLRALAITNVFVGLATGIRERSCDLRWNKISELSFILPSSKEQKEIAEYLDNKCSEIDSLISLKQSKIEKLKEYKKSLIYEYVTGKKEIEV